MSYCDRSAARRPQSPMDLFQQSRRREFGRSAKHRHGFLRRFGRPWPVPETIGE